jgi:hypothetical protein
MLGINKQHHWAHMYKQVCKRAGVCVGEQAWWASERAGEWAWQASRRAGKQASRRGRHDGQVSGCGRQAGGRMGVASGHSGWARAAGRWEAGR